MACIAKQNLEKKLFVSWEKFDALCRLLVEKIRKDRFEPEVIVAVSRGGLVPAQIISHELKNNELYVIKVEYYKDDIARADTKQNKEPIIVQKLDKSVEGKRVLVVDEVTDSGATALAVKEYIESLNPKEVRFLTVHYKPWSRFKPDYFAEIANGWVVYPWSADSKRK
jgi:hypothetical protein